MSFRNRLPGILIGTALLAMGTAHAEDPFLGQIKEIKCVNCTPGWVTLVVHDPIETRDFELYLKDTDYNKIITPLPGKRIHDRNGECFYWMERPKAPKQPPAGTAPAGAATAGKADPKSPSKEAMVGKSSPGNPAGKGPAVADGKGGDSAHADATMPAHDTTSMVPPPSLENQGTPSTCIRFYRQTN